VEENQIGKGTVTDQQPTQTGLSPQAIQRLVEAHRQFLGFLQKRVESREAAEDILQTAFVRGLERGGEVRDEETVVAWFYRILRNAVIDYYRRRASTERMLEGWAREFDEAVEPELANEVCQCVSALMQSLKQEYREALQIVDLGERSLNHLAASAGISPANAAVRVHRAREALRKQVTTACGTCAEHGCLDCRCK
jgi:RNA polymerase sigma-70 factor (ECF subfamily)